MIINLARRLRMAQTILKIDTSFRYGVMGVYRDRDLPIIRVYPFPFVRFTLGKLNGGTES